MGGLNQASCPPPSASMTANPLKQTAKLAAAGLQVSPVRFHEDAGNDEFHFHDDQGGMKCAIAKDTFIGPYHRWRTHMSGEFVATGHDGQSPPGHTSVKFVPYTDDAGELQVSMVVSSVKMGQTIKDLDVLAGF